MKIDMVEVAIGFVIAGCIVMAVRAFNRESDAPTPRLLTVAEGGRVLDRFGNEWGPLQ